MKILTLSRGGLDLARAFLHRPVATIGRSPACDVVLRAQGIAPIHFLLEWIGTGNFDPSHGQWLIFDVSDSADQSGEGILLGAGPVLFKDLQFKWIEDRLENYPEIGGAIQAALDSGSGGSAGGKGSLLELIQIRSDSGAVEDVVHLDSRIARREVQPLSAFPEFQITVGSQERKNAVQILLSEMPGAQVFRKGVLLETKRFYEIGERDLLELRWKAHRFYVRLVDPIQVPLVKRQVIKEPLLFKLSLGGFGAAFFGIVMVLILVNQNPLPEEPHFLPRVAKVEVQKIVEYPPEVAHQEVAHQEVAHQEVAHQEVARQEVARQEVSQFGILGALNRKNGAPKGPGVRADMILNAGVINQGDSAVTPDAKVVLHHSPAGTIGTGSRGSRTAGADLSAAATILQGSAGFNPKNTAAIVSTGEKPAFQQGNVLSTGSAKSHPRMGEIGVDQVDTDVRGGLDRETVRRIIAQHRHQIRACYERALISDTQLTGRVVYKWNISPVGPVVSAEVTRTTLSAPVLEGCVKGVIRSMKFPAAVNGRPTTVIYPFVFQSRS